MFAEPFLGLEDEVVRRMHAEWRRRQGVEKVGLTKHTERAVDNGSDIGVVLRQTLDEFSCPRVAVRR